MFIKTIYGCERFGSFVPSLASVFNIVHTFVCGDDAGPSTNANESIPDGAVNVNSETKALTCAKFSAYVENIFIYTPKHLLVVTLLSLLMPFAETKAVWF